VRQGASWTAAYHLQLTVAAVARPVRSGVGALGVLAAERSWVARPDDVCPEQRPAGLERSGVVAVADPASRHATASVAGVQHAVSAHPVSASGIRLSSRPVSGPLGWSSEVRRSAGCCPPVRCPPVRCPPVRCPPVRCPAVRPDASVSSHAQAVAVGTRSRWPGDRDHRNGWRPQGLPGRRRPDRRSRRPGRGRRCPSRVGQWKVGGGPGPPGWCGPRRPRLTTERPGRPGRRPERPSRAAALWAREQAAARGGGIRRVAAVLGWVRDHGAWSSPSLTPGWADPQGPLEGPAGMGVRPQRGPSWQPALPARCRQRSDLRRWVVGLPGLEPGTSS
jgi:hypothetical protein